MLDALYKHGLLGGSSGSGLTEQIEKPVVVATGETIAKGDPVFFDNSGLARKVKVNERGINERGISVQREIPQFFITDENGSQLILLPNNFETRFVMIENNLASTEVHVKICAIRNDEIVILYQSRLTNINQPNTQIRNVKLLFIPTLNRFYVSYEGGSGATRGYGILYKFDITHTDTSVTVATGSASDTTNGDSSGNTGVYGHIAFKNGMVSQHGVYYNGTSFYNTVKYYDVNGANTSSTTGFLGSNNSTPNGVAHDFSNYNPAHNVGLVYNAQTPILQAFSNSGSVYTGALTSGTHYVGSVASATTKRFRNAEDRYLSVYTTDPLGREHRLALLVYSTNGTTFTINTINISKTRYNITIYKSWLLAENRVMVLAYDNTIQKFRLFIFDINNTTNVVTLTKEIVLHGNLTSLHGADFLNGLLILSTFYNQNTMIRSYYLENDEIREFLHHGISNETGVVGSPMKVVLKGKVTGLTGLTKDKDYYIQRDGTVGLDNRGVHLAYAENDSTLVIDVPFYEKEVVTTI